MYEGRLGACHGLEIPFVFDTLDAEGFERVLGPVAPGALAAAMHKAWVDFATTGDPGWPAYDLQARPTMIFDVDSAVITDPRGRRRTVWDNIR
jgi:para-nitrobenzyl esterase